MKLWNLPLAAALTLGSVTVAVTAQWGLPASDLEAIAGYLGTMLGAAVAFGRPGGGGWQRADRLWALAGALGAVGLAASVQLVAARWLQLGGPHVVVASAGVAAWRWEAGRGYTARDVVASMRDPRLPLWRRIAVVGVTFAAATAPLWWRWRWHLDRHPVRRPRWEPASAVPRPARRPTPGDAVPRHAAHHAPLRRRQPRGP